MFIDTAFQSEGATLRGRLYGDPGGSNPIVVMAHGTSATITMAIDGHAAGMHAAGFDVLLFDHRNFGLSAGEPRQQINPWVQARGYRDAVRFLREQSRDRKIVLWGDSYSGMVVLVAGALIDGIDAVIAQIPACGIALPDVRSGDPDAVLAQMRATFEHGDVSGGPEQTMGPMPVVSADQQSVPSLLVPIQAFRWFIEYGGRHGTRWENRASRVIPDTPVPFHAWHTAPYLSMPVLMMVGRDDEMVHCAPDVQLAVYDRIPGAKAFQEVDGGHFGLLWQPGALFDQAVARQVDFLQRTIEV